MKYLTNSGLSYFFNKIKAYLTSSTYLNSIGIFPNNDNSVDLGDSSKNIKMIYTKGITINGTQFSPSDYATLSGLSTVATSGSYNDLSNKPTIPSKTSDLTNDSGFLTSHQDLSGYVPRGGGEVLSGSRFSRTVNNSELQINGGTGWGQGASIALGGKDKTGNTGVVYLHADDSTSFNQIEVCPDGRVIRNLNGTAKHIAMAEDVVPRSGGAVMTGSIYAATSSLGIGYGLPWGEGGLIYTYRNTHSSNPGIITFSALLSRDNYKNMTLYPDGTWTWQGTAVQLVSDQRLKQQITEIDDKLLDAWQDVDLVQFKYNDAVDAKKDKARLHTGYVVQQIDKACKSHGVDVSAYGLYCHEEYPQETEEVEVTQEDGTIKKETKVIREASEHYSLRYTETLVVECAYLRKRIKELEERLEKLEGK